VKTNDRNPDFARTVTARQPGLLEGRTGVTRKLSSTIARSLSMKPFQILCFTIGPRGALEILELVNRVSIGGVNAALYSLF